MSRASVAIACVLAPVCALLPACTSTIPEPADAGDVALPTGDAAALLAEIQPVELRVHALTRLERAGADQNAGAQRLAVHLELLDKYGQGVKGLGRAVIVLHPHRTGVPEALVGGVGAVAGGVGGVVSGVGGVVSGVGGAVGGAVGGVVDTVTGRAAENHDKSEPAPPVPPEPAAQIAAASPLDGPLPSGALRYVRDLTQPKANADAYDWVTRCYVVPCGDLTTELLDAAARGNLRVEATFSVLRPDGTRRVLSASYVLPAVK